MARISLSDPLYAGQTAGQSPFQRRGKRRQVSDPRAYPNREAAAIILRKRLAGVRCGNQICQGILDRDRCFPWRYREALPPERVAPAPEHLLEFSVRNACILGEVLLPGTAEKPRPRVDENARPCSNLRKTTANAPSSMLVRNEQTLQRGYVWHSVMVGSLRKQYLQAFCNNRPGRDMSLRSHPQ